MGSEQLLDPLIPAPAPNDGVWIQELYDSQAAGLLKYLNRRVGAAAEDLLSEIFLAVIASAVSFDPQRGSPTAWLYGIASNVLRGYHRQEQRRLDTAARHNAHTTPIGNGPDTFVPGTVDAQRRIAELADRISALSPGDREVLLLSAWTALDTNEIATALGIPVGTVRSRLHRVRRQLREQGVGQLFNSSKNRADQ
ncbi:RNA polymerase sigma factor [Nakamurella antarctica]|uniref:RNA polymerase sigma factor n=1 Tax=Nakamurella antarctica TaxID=1902245 RepID=A0A3G8ZQY1_9ACTN|nr:RNA polymerase sigma factor [Nakamurella antarctica]AZI59215.1 RNA polymerase sigma factor [Nakamurella antarctica]